MEIIDATLWDCLERPQGKPENCQLPKMIIDLQRHGWWEDLPEALPLPCLKKWKLEECVWRLMQAKCLLLWILYGRLHQHSREVLSTYPPQELGSQQWKWSLILVKAGT
jgi:hypothetical protein